MLKVTILTLKRESIRLYFGSGQVLVGLLDFKSSDGQRCPWWVRFPCTSAKLYLMETSPNGLMGTGESLMTLKRRKKCLG
jgi:hypothetical protein